MAVSEFLDNWWGGENGRLDALLQYTLHMNSPSPQTAHAVLLIFHLINIILLVLLVRKFCSPFASYMAGVVFAIHPQGMRAVLWASNFCYIWGAFSLLVAAHLLLAKNRFRPFLMALSVLVIVQAVWVHEQVIVLAPYIALLAFELKNVKKIKTYLPVLLFCLAGIFGFFMQKNVSKAGKAQMLEFDRFIPKAALQLKQMTARTLSPGLRQTVLPLLTGKVYNGWAHNLLWAGSAVAVILGMFLLNKIYGSNDEYLSNGEDDKNYYPLMLYWIAFVGLFMFVSGFLIGILAPHPYLVKRMFYMPSVGLAISCAAFIDLIFRFGKNYHVRYIFYAVVVLFAFICPPVIMKQGAEFADESVVVRKLNTYIDKIEGETEGKASIFVIGGSNLTFGNFKYKRMVPYRLPLEKNTRILFVKGKDVKEARRIDVFNVVENKTESQKFVSGTEDLLVRFFDMSSLSKDAPLAVIGGKIFLHRVTILVADNTEAKARFEFETSKSLLLHRVYARVVLEYSNGKTLLLGDDRKPSKKIEDGRFKREFSLSLPYFKDAYPVSAIVRFDTIAAPAELGKVTGVDSRIKEKSDKIFINLKLLKIKE
jgi:hypothetical protein